LQRQDDALGALLAANRHDRDRDNDLVLSEWSVGDQEWLGYATNLVLNERTFDPALPAVDRGDFVVILDVVRKYVRANNRYWVLRAVRPELRFEHWLSPSAEPWMIPVPAPSSARVER
jgi:hypothetical protein